jgi:hypothetical protein
VIPRNRSYVKLAKGRALGSAEGERPELHVFCPECAEREFGGFNGSV